MSTNRPFPRTCIAPNGAFIHGIHKPQYTAFNYRENDWLVTLGKTIDDQPVDNARNFPEKDVTVASASWVFEIPNPFPFMGVTFIPKGSADRRSEKCNPFRELLQQRRMSGVSSASESPAVEETNQGRQSVLALAKTSQDPAVLSTLAGQACRFTRDKKGGDPSGLVYEKTPSGQLRPVIVDEHLFELVSNNPCLPDSYKQCMVLTPGVQGDSPIVGEYCDGTHIWEYLRENSYIPWGHYAANMAQDAVRYIVASLSSEDVRGLRHLYYQRIYTQLAEGLGLSRPENRQTLSVDELEEVRLPLKDAIVSKRDGRENLPFTGNIWGQNFGFDLSPSGYRLNASHQQIHQQYALVPPTMATFQGGKDVSGDVAIPTFVLGDLAARFAREYHTATGQRFFETYLKALANNERLDGSTDKPRSLIIYEDDIVIVFVPKAQRSQGEIQIITKVPCGNIVEASTAVRASLDHTVLTVFKILEGLGAEMINAFEISKRYDNPDADHRLMYCFLPKHPQSPGSFTEFQQRWIIGHYPEDFAQTCREVLRGLK